MSSVVKKERLSIGENIDRVMATGDARSTLSRASFGRSGDSTISNAMPTMRLPSRHGLEQNHFANLSGMQMLREFPFPLPQRVNARFRAGDSAPLSGCMVLRR
jgi:hypothetical protein